MDGGRKTFLLAALFCGNCAWREDKGCRGLAKRLSTCGYEIVFMRTVAKGAESRSSRYKEGQRLIAWSASCRTCGARGNLIRKVVPDMEVSSTATEPPWS